MTSRKIPSVRMLKGKVMILRNRPTVAFSRPITTAAISAGTKPRHMKSGHKMGNNQQRERAQNPMEKKPHSVVLRELALNDDSLCFGRKMRAACPFTV